jgi:ribosomal protein S18 acetylase RimI-like enzyme
LINDQRQGFVKKLTLTGAELTEIEQLTDICNNKEGLHMRLGWLQIGSPNKETNDLLYYEDNKLAGYLNISSYGIREKELTGMVHPDYRRKGIFRALLAAAKEECLHRGVQKLLLISEHASHSGLAFVKAIGAQQDFSEHEMVLGTFYERGSFNERFRMRNAGSDDAEVLISIMTADFDDVEQARFYVTELLQQPGQRIYLGLLDGEPVGCLRLDEMDDEVGIYGFVVRPEYRGHGYGRQMLEETIRTIHAKGPKRIMLEVETDNTNAIGLYRSCGFQVKTTYDYYSLNI